MSKYGFYILTLVILVPLLTGCTGKAGEVKAPLGQEFSLSIGQSARITGENLEIKFEEVTEDSRCPKNVTCIWAGRVSCIVQITDSASSSKMVLTEPGLTDQYTKETYKNYQLTFHVQPYPEEGRTISPDEYRLLLNISK